MKTADLYFNVRENIKQITISGEYLGGTWRVDFAHGLYFRKDAQTYTRFSICWPI